MSIMHLSMLTTGLMLNRSWLFFRTKLITTLFWMLRLIIQDCTTTERTLKRFDSLYLIIYLIQLDRFV